MQSPHWIIPFPPPNAKPLNRLLAGMRLIDTDTQTEQSLSTPQERVLARAYGLEFADGQVPWAAWTVQQQSGDISNQAWAFIDLCHWRMERALARMLDPDLLELSCAQSEELLALMQPYFATHGISLHYLAPTRWLASGEIFRGLSTSSTARVTNHDVDPWLPANKVLRLLQNEMQMLLYAHPLTETQEAQNKPSVNSFWISGAGALPSRVTAPTHVRVLDAAKLDFSQPPAKVSLCGVRGALTFEAGGSFSARFMSPLRPQRLSRLIEML